MRLLAYMVTKDEASRYLDACLVHATEFLDGIAVFDDNSVDETPEIAARYGAKVCSRGDLAPAFLEHESEFRQAAWDWFEDALQPKLGDWVLALDADEFLVSPGSIRAAVETEILRAASAVSLRIPVPEVFGVEDGNVNVRVDGFWGKIQGTRLFRWLPNGCFSGRAMGSGAEPTYVLGSRICESTNLFLLHYGYADPNDREMKYKRYTALIDHGHNNSHIQSIIQPPTLRVFDQAPIPAVWRGRRS